MMNDMNAIKPPTPPKGTKSYFTLKEECDELLNWFDNNYLLDHTANEMEDIMNLILSDKKAVDYVSGKNCQFEMEYRNHYIDNNKNFVLMNRTCSLIMSVCMRMWH